MEEKTEVQKRLLLIAQYSPILNGTLSVDGNVLDPNVQTEFREFISNRLEELLGVNKTKKDEVTFSQQEMVILKDIVKTVINGKDEEIDDVEENRPQAITAEIKVAKKKLKNKTPVIGQSKPVGVKPLQHPSAHQMEVMAQNQFANNETNFESRLGSNIAGQNTPPKEIPDFF